MLIRYGDSPQLSQFGLLCNTEDAGLFSNVSATMTLGLPEVEYYKAVDQLAVVCGGGPSLAGTLVNIRALKAAGARVFALNNTAKFLTEHGIKPDVQIIVDPRPQNVAFIEKPWADELLLASQCHPSLFTQAKEIGYRVRVWHSGTKGIENYVTTGKQCWIGGGLTVGLSGLCLIYTLGHREIHLFGYDSSHSKDKSHAYQQAIDCEMVSCAVENQVFDCSLAMAAQAHEFKNTSDMLASHGCKLQVYGEGLLPTLWRSWQREKTQKILTAVFDLGLYAPEEFGDFLEAAEGYRAANRFDRMDIVFEPGPMFGFRNTDPLQDTWKSVEALWGRSVKEARRHHYVRNIEVLRQRRAVNGEVFPVGYAEDSPRSHYLENPMEKIS